MTFNTSKIEAAAVSDATEAYNEHGHDAAEASLAPGHDTPSEALVNAGSRAVAKHLGLSVEAYDNDDTRDEILSAYDAAYRKQTAKLVSQSRCDSGTATGERCENVATTHVDYMPEHLRESHRAAGNSGSYPANGSERLHVCADCAEMLAETSPAES